MMRTSMRGKRTRGRGKQSGFTLIEMMITVAIVGVLGAVALPSYGYYFVQTKRTEAVIGLGAIGDMQRAYSLAHDDQYAADFDTLGYSGTERIDANTVRGTRYTYSLSQPWGTKSWYCSATSNLDGDDWPDVLVTGDRP